MTGAAGAGSSCNSVRHAPGGPLDIAAPFRSIRGARIPGVDAVKLSSCRKLSSRPRKVELNHLVAEHQTALQHAVEIASPHGMESPLFLEADKKAGKLVRQIFAKYLYAPLLLIGLNGAALYMMAHNHHYFWLALPILAAIGLSLLMERVLPYEEEWNRSHDDVAKDIAHGIVYEAGNLITLGLLLLVSLTLPKGSFWPQSLPLLGQFLLALLVADCIMTLIHYWSHRLEWLWKFHAIHHGVQRLYGFNGFVRHPLHQALDVALGTLPLVVAGLPIPLAAALGVAIAIQLILQHSNVDYRLGPFQKLLSVGPVHRLHHVTWPGMGNVNFGLFLTLWDRMLGTFKLNSDRLPSATDIGIQDCPNFPQSYARQLRVPFEEGFPCGEIGAPKSATLREDLLKDFH